MIPHSTKPCWKVREQGGAECCTSMNSQSVIGLDDAEACGGGLVEACW
jgi:hypothetical protein